MAVIQSGDASPSSYIKKDTMTSGVMYSKLLARNLNIREGKKGKREVQTWVGRVNPKWRGNKWRNKEWDVN